MEGTTNLTVKNVKLMRHGSLVLPFQSPAQILANHSLQVTVPCLDFFTFQLITPCGNLTLPREGIQFSTAFGKYTMPGADFLQPSLRKTERELSQYTVLFIVLAVVGWFCYTFWSNRTERSFSIGCERYVREGSSTTTMKMTKMMRRIRRTPFTTTSRRQEGWNIINLQEALERFPEPETHIPTTHL